MYNDVMVFLKNVAKKQLNGNPVGEKMGYGA